MARRLFVLLLASAAACCGPESKTIRSLPPSVSKETLSQAGNVGFEYQRRLAAAWGRDRVALEDLIRFTRCTDAAGALGHGVVLVEIAQHVGDWAFAWLLSRQNRHIQRIVWRHLECGVAYGQPPRDPLCTAELFPWTWRIVAALE